MISKLNDVDNDYDESKIHELIKDKTESELFLIFEEIIDYDPFQFEIAIKIVANELFADSDDFIKVFCKLIKEVSGDLAFNRFLSFISPLILKDPTLSMKIIEKLSSNSSLGICSGILIYPLLDDNPEARKNVCDCLKSEETDEQLHALTALKLYFLEKGKESEPLLDELITNSGKINSENAGMLVDCLIKGFHINESQVDAKLKKVIKNRGLDAALAFINLSGYQNTVSAHITKQSLEFIEKKDPKNPVIDISLSQIYSEDKDYVIEKMRDRINITKSLGSYRLLNVIKENELDPVLKMLDEEIDRENISMVHFGNSMLEEILDEEEILDWCELRVNDKKSRKIILKILAKILTHRTDFEKSEIRDKSIKILKTIVSDEGLDYDKETKNVVDFGKDDREGVIHKENTIKALHMIDILLFPKRHVNIKNLEKNLDNYPHLCNAVGKEWLIKNAKSKNPHILAYIYDKIPDIAQINELAKKFESDDDHKIGLAFKHDSLLNDYLSQVYWENVFKILSDYGINISRGKIRGGDDSILTELEIIARLAPNFNITPEPDIDILKPKKLDLLLEHGDKKALIEIAVVNERKEVELAKETAITVPGGKVKSTLLNKFNGQLKKGEIDPGIPIILILRLSPGLDEKDVYDAIYGELGFQIIRNKCTKEVIETVSVRDNNSFFELENSNIISGIITYKRDYSSKDPLVGRIFRIPDNITPKNELDEDLRVKIRDALFGESETSHLESLMLIEDIDEKTAQLLYSKGIEDLETLSIIPDSRLKIKELQHLNLIELKKEAKRIILALNTNSIIYLKGMEKNSLDILQKTNIHLITQLLELDKNPDGIDSKSWKIIIDDAKRIKNTE